MAPETTNPDEHLLPARHGQGDLFICDVADAALKDLIPQMEHPFYSLSKKPDTAIRKYEHNGNWLEIVPSVKGLATIYDKDVLIYCVSQIMEKLKRKEKVSQRVRITSYDLLVFTNRGTSGRDYDALCEAIDRLAGTRITTNIRTGDEEQRDSFGLIDAASIRRKHGLDGRLQWVEIKLSDWVFNAIRGQEVLTLHRDYFRLGKPLERRIYELARKHCGRQSTWQISLEILLKKSGSQSSLKRFRQHVKEIAQHDHLPDYRLIFDEEQDMVAFFNREGKLLFTPKEAKKPVRRVMTFQDVRACFDALGQRERLIAKLAILAGLRPGEIFALTWGRMEATHADIRQRVYRRKLNTPKTDNSLRKAALSEGVLADIDEWRNACAVTDADAWVFPSERMTPLSKDNCWYRIMRPALTKVGLGWCNFQVMRRTHATLMRMMKADPKLVADQLGHTVDVSLNVYTQSPVESRLLIVNELEKRLLVE